MISSIDVNRLFTSYPNLFQQFNGIFNIDNGWLPIVEDLCLVLNFATKEEKINIYEIQKKFGIMFIEHDNKKILIRKLVHMAEKLSHTMCEKCGNVAKLYSTSGSQYGELFTLCNKHAMVKYKPYEYKATKIMTLLAE